MSADRPPQPGSGALRVIVVGAGILGVATARALRLGGAAVTLVTEAAAASGASGRSLSWLNSAGPRSAGYHRLRLAGIDRYRTFAARRDAARFLRFDGGLTWAAPGESFAERFAHELGIGYDTRWLAPEEIAAWTPGVDPDAVAAEGAIFNPGEGWVELPSIVGVLLGDFLAAGGVLRADAGRCRVETDGSAARAVTTGAGIRLPADAVVLATGPSVPAELARLGAPVPSGDVPAAIVRTKPLDHPLAAVLNTPGVALRRTPDCGFAMDSAWSEEALVTEGDRIAVPDGTVERLLAEASGVLAGHPRLEAVHVGVGWKPIPGDGEPVLGAVPGIAGLHVAYTHSGATLGLVVGELLAQEIVTGRMPEIAAPFTPARFARKEQEQEQPS